MIRLPWRIGGTERSTERIEAFSDGVFAIAITLLILDIKVPHPADGPIDLWQTLLRLWPSYFAFVLSFVTIGIYWANHHYLFKLFKQTNHALNLLNLLLLLCISFLPLPTAVLGNYMLTPDNQTTAVTFYAFGLLLPSIAWCLLWLYASGQPTLMDDRLDCGFIVFLRWQYVASIAIYLAAIAVSLAAPWWGLGLCTGLTMLYLLPPVQPKYIGT